MSRESIVYDNHTRDYVQKLIKSAEDEVAELVAKELKEEDFLEWIVKANQVLSSAASHYSFGRTSALSTLARLIDRERLKAKYPKDNSIVFTKNAQKFFWGINIRSVYLSNGSYNRNSGSYEKKIKREPLESWNNFKPQAIYELSEDGRASNLKDRYLCKLHGNFLQIKKQDDKEFDDFLNTAFKDKKQTKKLIKKYKDLRDKIWDLLFSSKKDEYKIEFYDDVEIPEDYKKQVEEEEKESKASTLTPKQARELKGQVVCYTIARKDASYGATEYRRTKREPVLEKLDSVLYPVIYGTQKDDNKLMMLAEVFHKNEASYNYKPDYFDINLATAEGNDNRRFLLRFSKRNIKFIKQNPNFIHVDKFMYNHSKKVWSTGDFFIEYFTAKKAYERLSDLRFLENYSIFNEQICDAYNDLKGYVKRNYSSYIRGALERNAVFTDFSEKVEKAYEFQKFVEANPTVDTDTLKAKSKNLLGNDRFEQAVAIRSDIMEVIQELENYAESIKDLFNEIKFLVQKDYATIPGTAEKLINQVLKEEGLDTFELSENSLKTLENLNK